MDPVSLAVISIGTSIASAGIGAMGAMQSAQAQSAAAKYQAQVAQVNQQIQQQNAAYERQKGQVDAQNQDLKNRAQQGKLKAALGASGFDVNSGSPLDVQDSSARLGRLDTETTRTNAERRAREFDISAQNQGFQSQLYSAQASNAKSAGMMGAASSLIGGISSVSDKWMSYQQKGIFGSSSNIGSGTSGFY